MHGVKGTPMSPWGETPKDKIDYDGIPVLTRDEVNKLVDWLYTSLPGANVIKGIQDVPKWQYTPKDVIEELKREGVPFQPGKMHDTEKSSSLPGEPSPLGANAQKIPQELLALFPRGDFYYASLKPQVAVSIKPQDQEVEQIFDVVPNPNPGEDKYAYYIRKIYYTDYNIAQGKRFFEMNCASCHGKEGDGSGMRASIMFDAKPRMLTNLDWIKTHDDIRLLRSIKYGVPGTAMTPWGDQTSALQRLQLVVFIRSLTEDKELREELSEALYKTFESTDTYIEEARALTYPYLESLEMESKKLRKTQSNEPIGEAAFYEGALKNYEQQLKLSSQEKAWQALDKQLVSLKALVKQEKEIYSAIGVDLIDLRLDDVWSRFLHVITLNNHTFVLNDQGLQMPQETAQNQERTLALEEIAKGLEGKREAISKEISALPEHEQAALKTKEEQYRLARTKILIGVQQLKKLREEQIRIFDAYQEKLHALKEG
jgi:mono/diheme cytochrome c family protein